VVSIVSLATSGGVAHAVSPHASCLGQLAGDRRPAGNLWAKTAYGIWKENQLDPEVWQVIDKAVAASEL
jgi:hypothetical protein